MDQVKYCYNCGKKVKLCISNDIKYLHCKKCTKFFPYEEKFTPIDVSEELVKIRKERIKKGS